MTGARKAAAVALAVTAARAAPLGFAAEVFEAGTTRLFTHPDCVEDTT